jgi:hypothetical protein
MSRFGFFPEQSGGPVSVPPGYGSATVRLGNATETVFFSLAIWNTGDYVDHWRHGAAKRLREREAFLFCTDLTKQNASVFAAFPEGEGYTLEEWLIPRRTFTVSGREIVLVSERDMVRSGGDTSSWWVDEAAIADFANAV